jgi:pimeloyl-ACP methyl ester carboxylesterase
LPVPAKDGFYQPPALTVMQAAAPGTILKIREIKPKAYFWLDVPARAWQLMFRSTDGKGQAVASVTTVLVPFKAPSASADRVLLSYQAAYDALTTACAPSYAITKGAQWEQVFINRALARGWVVSVPDYEGLQSHWGDGMNSAHGVLDGVRAALQFGPLMLPGEQTRVGLVGYSGGGLASAWAAERAPDYAPELRLAGVVAGGVPVDMGNVARKVDGGFYSGLYLSMSIALARANPEIEVSNLLSAKGKEAYKEVQEMCAGQMMTGTKDSVLSHLYQPMSKFVVVPDLLEMPAMKNIIARNRLGQRMPTAPLYIYQGKLDPVMPLDDVDQLVQRYCQAGVKVRYRRVLGEHLLPPFTEFGGAMDFLSARFAGQPMSGHCPE